MRVRRVRFRSPRVARSVRADRQVRRAAGLRGLHETIAVARGPVRWRRWACRCWWFWRRWGHQWCRRRRDRWRRKRRRRRHATGRVVHSESGNLSILLCESTPCRCAHACQRGPGVRLRSNGTLRKGMCHRNLRIKAIRAARRSLRNVLEGQLLVACNRSMQPGRPMRSVLGVHRTNQPAGSTLPVAVSTSLRQRCVGL